MNTLFISDTARNKVMLSGLVASLATFYMPVHSFIMPVLWLVGIDILTGVYVARIVEHKDLTSRALFRKLPQLLLFLVAMTAAMHSVPLRAGQTVSVRAGSSGTTPTFSLSPARHQFSIVRTGNY